MSAGQAFLSSLLVSAVGAVGAGAASVAPASLATMIAASALDASAGGGAVGAGEGPAGSGGGVAAHATPIAKNTAPRTRIARRITADSAPTQTAISEAPAPGPAVTPVTSHQPGKIALLR